MKTASGCGKPRKRLRRRAGDDGKARGRRGSAHCARCGRRARGGLRSRRRDWRGRPASIRWRSSPSRRRRPTAVRHGAARAPTSVIARISRLVIWPSFSNQSSGRPGSARQHARAAIGDDFERDGVERGDVVEREALRRALRERARAAPPIASQTVSSRSPHAARREQRRQLAPASRRPTRAPGSARRAADAERSPRAGGHAERGARNPAAPSRAARRRGESRGRGSAEHLVGRRSGASAASRRRRRTDRRSRARRRARRAAPGSRRAHPRSATARRRVSAASGPASARWRSPPTTKRRLREERAVRQERGRRARPRRGRRPRASVAAHGAAP